LSLNSLLDVLACLGHLGVAALVPWRPGVNPPALLLGLRSIDLFAWKLAIIAHLVSGHPERHWLVGTSVTVCLPTET
jgi:hypothetical protein